MPRIFLIAIFALCLLSVLLIPTRNNTAYSWGCPVCICFATCACSARTFSDVGSAVSDQHNITRIDVFGWSNGSFPGVVPGFGASGPPFFIGGNELGEHEWWLAEILFAENFLPAMMMMAEQFSAIMLQQMLIVGTYFDASIQLETQRHFQTLTAKAHSTYHSNVQMCMFGTAVRSLGNVDRRGDLTMSVLSQGAKRRGVGSTMTGAAMGPDQDLKNRREQFVAVWCDEHDNNKILGTVIDSSGGTAGAFPDTGLTLLTNGMAGRGMTLTAGACDNSNRYWVNADIDYTRTIELPHTIDFDMDAALFFGVQSNDEEDVFALVNYLYGHRIPQRVTNAITDVLQNQDEVLDMRSVVAKRGVAENSFYAIAAMKSTGDGVTEDSFVFHERFLYDLGHPWGTADTNSTMRDLYSVNGSPSYMAQMEFLAKVIYQRPEFYTNLHTTPENVDRISVSMQAIDLMLERDTFKSQLRTEAVMAELLEMEIIKKQHEVMNNIRNLHQEVWQ